MPEVSQISTDKIYQKPAPEGYQDGYQEFQEQILRAYRGDSSFTLIRINDGEYYFLTNRDHGNVLPGRRHFRIQHDESFRQLFWEGFQDADLVGVGLNWAWRDDFIGRHTISNMFIPHEYVMISVASRWLITSLNSLGLIGAQPKLELVRRLLQYPEYCSYLGREAFDAFIPTPQLFAGDSPDELAHYLTARVQESSCRAFLVGMGIAKLAVLSQVAKSTGRVFIDVGTGIDALAGVVNPERPYMGSWRNFQLDEPSLYRDIDYCQVGAFRSRIVLESSSSSGTSL